MCFVLTCRGTLEHIRRSKKQDKEGARGRRPTLGTPKRWRPVPSTTSTSSVGLPRESYICLAWILWIGILSACHDQPALGASNKLKSFWLQPPIEEHLMVGVSTSVADRQILNLVGPHGCVKVELERKQAHLSFEMDSRADLVALRE